jgi:hypothetical protein
MSGKIHVLSKSGCSGPKKRNATSYRTPALVGTQFVSLPAAASARIACV